MAKKPVARKRGRGRPSTFIQKTFDLVCEKVSTGITLNEVCRQPGMPLAVTVRKWMALDTEQSKRLFNQYARAKELQLEALADEILEVADDGTNDWMTRNFRGQQVTMVNREATERSKIRLDARKWLLSKLARGKYGEQKETKPEDEGAVKIEGGLPPE